jgi:hypothetical protein
MAYSAAWVLTFHSSTAGLPTVAPTNSFGYKILWSYIPTALGMAIEPLLVLLGAYACMVGPYETLKKGLGQARSSRSLVLDYDKSPPHFQLWQSLRVRNFVLSALTIAILAVNFLAVALGGLFSSSSELFMVTDDLDRFTTPRLHKRFQTIPATLKVRPCRRCTTF